MGRREDLAALTRGIAVAGNYNRECTLDAGKRFRVMQNAFGIAAVRSADEQNDIRLGIFDLGSVIFRHFEGIDLDNLRAGAERSHFCRLGGQLRDESACDHFEAAGSR